MNIESLKTKIESNSSVYDPVIFEYTDSDFIAVQYVTEIAKQLNKDIQYLESLDITIDSLFFDNKDTEISVYRCDELTDITGHSLSKKNLFVITKKVSSVIRDTYNDLICTIPKLEKWQIIDYVYSILPSIDQKKLDELMSICNYDIYRIQKELEKVLLFSDVERPYVFDSILKYDLNDVSKYTVFNFTNALIKKDIKTITDIYPKLDVMDVDRIGLCTILINSFRDVITLQFDPRLTPESCGMQKNKFWAVKHNCGIFSNSQLVSIFQKLLKIDKQIKTGMMSVDIVLDYVVSIILST